ncbi:MAG TPA: hypothetical protein VF219_10395, partial [Vicinamibacterales bacterium]
TQDLGVVTSTSTQSHVFRAAGGYVITAVLTDTINNIVSQSTQVTVIPVQRPGIVITQSPNPGHSGFLTTLTIQITVPTGIGVQDVLVDFGDGIGKQDLGGQSSATLQYTWNTPTNRTFIVTVTVTDTSGQTTVAFASVAIANP